MTSFLEAPGQFSSNHGKTRIHSDSSSSRSSNDWKAYPALQLVMEVIRPRLIHRPFPEQGKEEKQG